MPMKSFLIFTTLGAGIWVCVLTFAGYLLGEHQDLLKEYLHIITISCIVIALAVTGIYLFIIRRWRKS